MIIDIAGWGINLGGGLGGKMQTARILRGSPDYTPARSLPSVERPGERRADNSQL